jgi:hypothetical protein
MKRNEVIVSGRQKDKRVLERIKESNVRLYKNGLTYIGWKSSGEVEGPRGPAFFPKRPF